MTKLWKRFQDAHSILGSGATLRQGVKWLWRREYIVCFLDLAGLQPTSPADPSARLTWLRDADKPLLREINPALDSKEVESRLACGQECLLMWRKNQAVHYRWHATGTVFLPYLQRELKLLPGDILMNDVYTKKSARRLGVGRDAFRLAVVLAKRQGLLRLFSLIAPWNPALRIQDFFASSRNIAAAGYCNWGPWRRHYLKGHIKQDAQGRMFVPPLDG